MRSVDNATGFIAAIGTGVSALAGLAAIRQWYLKRGDETREDRDTRRAQEIDQAEKRRQADLDRLYAGLWEQIRSLTARVEVAEGRAKAAEARADSAESRLEAAQAAIRAHEGTIAALQRRVAELESKEGGR